MSNQRHFVRQTTAVWLAFGLIASLLPGLAVAQDLSTRESLEKDWEWVREEPGEWQWKDVALRLRTQPGGIWGPAEPAKNVLVSKSLIEHAGSVEALIGLENPIRKWEQAGLLVYGDDDHFVKLIVEFIEGKFFVVMAWELGKQSKVVAKVETGLQEAWLRCVVDGNKVRGSWRKHGDSQWTEAAVCEFPEDLKRRFAIFTQTGPEKEMRWATVKGVIIKGHAARWPQFRGPNRDGKSPETGLLKKWPEKGPQLLRTISGVGGGFSFPVIAGERIYITGKVGDDLKIFCFDGSGRKIWEKARAGRTR